MKTEIDKGVGTTGSGSTRYPVDMPVEMEGACISI